MPVSFCWTCSQCGSFTVEIDSFELNLCPSCDATALDLLDAGHITISEARARRELDN